MNFKDEYQKANQHIVPDETFRKRMQSKMAHMEEIDKDKQQDMESEKDFHQRIKWYQRPAFVMVCFLIFVMAGGILVWNGLHVGKRHIAKTGTFDANMGNATTGGAYLTEEEDGTTDQEGGVFSKSKWYDENASADDIYQSFFKRINNADNLDTIYRSTDNTFTEEQQMNSSDIQRLLDALASGKESQQLFGGNKAVYYMAQCKDGVIIKFTIYDDHLLKFNDLGTVYEY